MDAPVRSTLKKRNHSSRKCLLRTDLLKLNCSAREGAVKETLELMSTVTRSIAINGIRIFTRYKKHWINHCSNSPPYQSIMTVWDKVAIIVQKKEHRYLFFYPYKIILSHMYKCPDGYGYFFKKHMAFKNMGNSYCIVADNSTHHAILKYLHRYAAKKFSLYIYSLVHMSK